MDVQDHLGNSTVHVWSKPHLMPIHTDMWSDHITVHVWSELHLMPIHTGTWSDHIAGPN